MVRGAGAGVQGPAGLAHEIFLKQAEDPGRARRQVRAVRLRAACKLDDVVPVRQAFAGSVQTLQALRGDCHSEKTLRESAQPTSLESRVAPGVMEYVWSRPGRLPLGPHRVGHLRAEPRGRGDAAACAGAHGRRVARRRGAHGQAQRERTEVVYSVRSSSSELDGAGADFSQAEASRR